MNGQAVPAIAARNLTKRFGDTTAVDGLSFEVGWGKVTGFLGPNGAGKTTTMRMILGLIAPTGGEASIMGRRYAELDDPPAQAGAALDAGSFHPRRSGRNALRVIAAAAEIPCSRVDEMLELVELTPAVHKKVGAYSLGMKRRLALAAALLGNPAVLVLDEPANGLDPRGIRWLRGFLRSYAAEGNAVFVSSHLLAEVSQVADEVIVIDRGRLVAQAPVAELTSDNKSLEDVFFDLTSEEGIR